MSATSPEIVPLRREHLVDWFGEDGNRPTVKGIAALVDGKLIAIAGVRYVFGTVVMFCGLRDEARPYRKTMHKVALALVREAGERHRRLIAEPDDDEPTSRRWLSRLGFEPDDDGIWVWRHSRQSRR
jgi:hypothetical protein